MPKFKTGPLTITLGPMSRQQRPYVFYDSAVSICSVCLIRVEAKIVIEEKRVVLDKWCPKHGKEKVIISDYVDYWRMGREEFLSKSEMPNKWNTPLKWGCPYDCGICPSHEQHGCLTLIEITDGCNLRCPICYAGSGPEHMNTHRTLEEIEMMLDAVVDNEGTADVVQISGGEPTIHPDFFEILDAAKRRKIRHLMVNTNGVRIATEDGFAERLATYAPGFEVYLQFDSLEANALMDLRGADLSDIRKIAIKKLNLVGLSTTLVLTVKKNVNDHEMGAIIDWATTIDCIRGVTIQPIQDAGRTEGLELENNRMILSEIRRNIGEQSEIFGIEDILPVPCHPGGLAMAYGLKFNHQVTSISGKIDPHLFANSANPTIQVEFDKELHKLLGDSLTLSSLTEEGTGTSLAELLCCIPSLETPKEIGYENVFRIIIMQFIDAHDFDLREIKRTCVHIVAPDLRIIPFDTYNLFYRGSLEKEKLDPIRRRLESAGLAAGHTETSSPKT